MEQPTVSTLSPVEVAHLDNVLMAEVAQLNELLGRYVLHFLDADADRVEPLGAPDEHALADRVTAVADGIHGRAERRERHGDPAPIIGRHG